MYRGWPLRDLSRAARDWHEAMGRQRGEPVTISRRIVLVALAAGWPGMRPVYQGSGTISVARERIARYSNAAGLVAPLTLAMARVVLPPGTVSRAVTPGGLRLIFVEAGLLGVALSAPGAAPISAADLAITAPLPDPNNEVHIPAGTSMTFGSPGVAMVRNVGSRPVVLLDTVVYPAEPRPMVRAFTTDNGVSFQLLASATARTAPSGPLTATLERIRLGALSILPDDLRVGVTLVYLEAGGLDLEARAGRVYAARAAASAPYAMPGALEPITGGERRNLTAGGVLFLPPGAEAGVRNAGQRPAELLALSIHESSRQ